MLKVFIVDDEVLARVGVKSLIDWNKNGFEITGEFDNGKTAFEAAVELNPDIIISDIKMPSMNGIELINSVKTVNPEIKFLMLSSHNDFDLVKEAMKSGAEDYILKLQMEPEDLLKVLFAIKEKIEQEHSLKKEKTEAESQHKKDLLELKNRFLKDLVYGKNYSESEIEEYFRLYDVDLHSTELFGLVFAVKNRIHLGEMLTKSIINIITESIKNYGTGYVVFMEPNVFIIICSREAAGTSVPPADAVFRMAHSIHEFIKNSLNIYMNIGISREYNGCRNIRQAYLEAREASQYIQPGDDISISSYDDIKDNSSLNSSARIDNEMNELSEALRAGNIDEINAAFDSLITNLEKTAGLSEKYLIGNSHILIFIINEFVDMNNLRPKDVWGEDSGSYYQVSGLRCTEDFIQWIMKIREGVTGVLLHLRESNTIILRAKQYVRSNIAGTVSLSAVSDYLGLSSSYFSRLFSEASGQGFIDYVTEEKIRLAKDLIKTTNLKMYEIAEAVGYENVHYFSRVFKKTAGLTPMEYKTGKSQDFIK